MNPSEVKTPAPWWQVVVVGRKPGLTLVRLVVLVALTLLSFRYVFVPIRVEGISMSPTYKNGERHWISPLLARLKGLQRGDVVAIEMSGRHMLYLKRVLGLPGERVRITKGEVYIDDVEQDEPYALDRAPWNWPTNAVERRLGPDEYFVVGDNRTMPADVHFFGVADRRRILGKLVR